MFYKKFNFLMNLTNSKNINVAKAINIDPSYVSRLRNGNRPLSKNPSIIKNLSIYFASRIKSKYQTMVLMDILHLNIFPNNFEELSEIIHSWLLSDTYDSVKLLFEGLSKKSTNKKEISNISINTYNNESTNYYFGIKGKQEAIYRLLKEVCNHKTNQTLLIFSEEKLDWLLEDIEFAETWYYLLQEILVKGNNIKIIHNFNRNLYELLELINKWLPMYSKELIEPYYYPRIRDNLFQQTLFIAPKNAALSSTSVDFNNTNSLYHYITDKNAIQANILLFNNILNNCKPLFKSFETISQKPIKLYKSIYRVAENIFTILPTISNIALPKNILDKYKSNISENLYLYILSDKEDFKHNIKYKNYVEFISLPSLEELKNCANYKKYSPFKDIDNIDYTKEDFKNHLKNILDYYNKYNNYHILTNNIFQDNAFIKFKENCYLLIINSTTNLSYFIFSENNLIKGLYNYFNLLYNNLQNDFFSNEDYTINKIEEIINFLY